uniref:NADP-dependent isocitrate dehydrogenase n=1 Tax=uncultured Pseudoalteromonas sp. TaxID=114053 RepID=UPI0030FBFF69
HFYLAMYWAKALAEQTCDGELKASFAGVAQALTKQEEKIVAELNSAQGPAMDISGYYFADVAQAEKAMRPSETLNTILLALL